MDFRQIDKDLQIEFATQKMNEEKVASQNLLRANSNPVYRKLDSLERELVFEISKKSPRSESFKNLKENLKTIREEKSKVLTKLGLKESDLKPKYSCKICSDTGFVGGRPCECYRKKKSKMLIEAFGLSTNRSCTFENFDTKICKNEKQAEALKKIANNLQKWAEKYPNNEKNNIFISGKTGVGKTYLTSCLANKFINDDKSVCFVSAFDLNESFLKYHTSFDKTKSSWIEPFIEADILFIDDLGTEPVLKNVTKNYLYLILSERERFSRPVIVTSNFNPLEILSRYDERINSRLCNKRYSHMWLIEGDDLRLTK
jgi:DNA replication protein DnaC